MKRCRRGSTLVESCAVLLLFLVLLVGVLDVSQVLFFHHVLNERLRTGARYAAVHGYSVNAIRNVVACNNPAAPPGSPGLFGLTPAMVEVSRHDAGAAADRIEIRVSTFSMQFMSPWLLRDFTPGPFRVVVPAESLGNAL
jgi:hypothetical protein